MRDSRDATGAVRCRVRAAVVGAAFLLIAAITGCGTDETVVTAPSSRTTPTEVSGAEPTAAAPTAQPTPAATAEPAPSPEPTSQPAPTAEPEPTGEPEPTAEPAPQGWVAPDEYEDYVEITDDYGAIQLEVPAEWAEIDGYFPFSRNREAKSGVGLQASPDLEGYTRSWLVPGVAISAAQRYESDDPERLLADNVARSPEAAECTPGPVETYEDPAYTGFLQSLTDCGGTETGLTVVSVVDDDVKVFLTVQTVAAADDDALRRILDTFLVVDSVRGALVVAPEAYSGYREVVDDRGVLRVEVPNEWADVSGGDGFSRVDAAAGESATYGTGMTVSTDAIGWEESWGVPGVSISATSQLDVDLATWFYGDYTGVARGGWFYRSECIEEGVYEYEDALYTGLYGNYVECGGGDTDMVVIVAAPPDDELVILLAVTMVTDADDEALQRILDSFEVIADPG